MDDLVGGLVLGVGVDVGGGTTCSLTRRVVDVSVDGGTFFELMKLEHARLIDLDLDLEI